MSLFSFFVYAVLLLVGVEFTLIFAATQVGIWQLLEAWNEGRAVPGGDKRLATDLVIFFAYVVFLYLCLSIHALL